MFRIVSSLRRIERSRAIVSALVLVILGLFPFTVARAQDPGPPDSGLDVIPQEYLDQIPSDILDLLTRKTEQMGGKASLLAAQALSKTSIAGKSLSPDEGPPGNAHAGKLTDVAVAATPFEEDEPYVVANPRDKEKMVASSHKAGFFPGEGFRVKCVAYASDDRGATWSAGTVLQQVRGQCSDAVLAYAPDGSRVYAAYIDVFSRFTLGPPPTITQELDILVSHSDDNGATWSAPVVALAGSPTIIQFNPFKIIALGFDYDKPWINTHVDRSESDFAYVTATRFDNFFPGRCHIAFTRSSTQGASWSSPALLESSPGGCGVGTSFVVQGSHPAGGLGGEVLVAWYNSGTDGFLRGSFQIRTRSSANHGATFGSIVVASTDSNELPFWLGPLCFYHRWWGGMFPSLAIDDRGGAHIAYTHNPANNFVLFVPGLGGPCTSTAESGDIRYISSSGAPYTAWSPPITVNDDGLVRAQGYPAIAIQHGDTVNITWEDHRLSPEVPTAFPNSSNLFYDTFYARRVPGHDDFFRNFRVSDTSSINAFIFIGDYTGLAANDTELFSIWTDRRNRTSIFQSDNDVFGSRIIAGGGTP